MPTPFPLNLFPLICLLSFVQEKGFDFADIPLQKISKLKHSLKLHTSTAFSRYRSNSLRLITFLLPIYKTNGQLGSSAMDRSLFTPILLYAAASSIVRFSLSLISTLKVSFIFFFLLSEVLESQIKSHKKSS